MNRINWTWIIDPTHQILISSLQVERVRHKSVSPHASLGELRCLPSTPSSVDMCFSRTFLAAEGNFSSAEQSPDLWYPGGCKPVTDTYLAVRDEKTTNQPKLNQGIVYVDCLWLFMFLSFLLSLFLIPILMEGHCFGEKTSLLLLSSELYRDSYSWPGHRASWTRWCKSNTLSWIGHESHDLLWVRFWKS